MQITGTVIAVIYQTADGYGVVEIAGDDPGIVVGSLPHIKVGEYGRFSGEYKYHPKYGRQFQAVSYETAPPVDEDGMVLFLSSDFVKGIGEVLARRLVDTFGEDTFDVIENDPEAVAAIPGITKTKAEELQRTFREYSLTQFRYAELMSLGLSAHQAEQAAEVLGGAAADRIRENPYLLAEFIKGIDFLAADRLAARMGIAQENPLRVESGVLHVLRRSLEEGNTCVRRDQLIPHLVKNLQVPAESVENALGSLTLRQKIIQRTYGTSDMVFLHFVYQTEVESAQKLIALLQAHIPTYVPETDILKAQQRFHLSEEQTAALRLVTTSNVSIITGGPGTGKTTILRALIWLLNANGDKTLLAAPTGRAAKRMQETTGHDAKTIHRLLEYAVDEEDNHPFFRINEEHPLKADAVLIDEVSMVDAFLFRSLLAGTASGTRLVLIGDADQLPSVGAGNVLRSILRSRVIPAVSLTYHFRNEGLLADAAHAILDGRLPAFDEVQFILREANDPETVREILAQEYADNRALSEDIQVIAPIKKTALGSVELNNLLRETVNPPEDDKPQIIRAGRLYRQGDRIMQTSNDYEREWKNPEDVEKGEGVFNGDIGEITAIRGSELEVRFDDGRVSFYDADSLEQLDGAFAYTIHKSQGNEFDVVILPMLYPVGMQSRFLSRSLLYTAVTRARKKVILVGSAHTLRRLIENDKRTARATGLAPELRFLADIVGIPRQSRQC